jgi:hypothetical protein
VRVALRETYGWMRDAAPMQVLTRRNVDLLHAVVAGALAADDQARVSVVVKGFRARGRAAHRLRAVVAHALDVHTWERCTS